MRFIGKKSETVQVKTTGVGRLGRLATGAALLCALLGALSFGVTPALAARNFLSRFSVSGAADAVTVDAAGNVWIASGNSNEAKHITEYSPYPSMTKEQEWNGEGQLECGQIESIAVNSVNGYVYVSNDCGQVLFFEPTGKLKGGLGGDYVSIDNSGGPSNGRIFTAEQNGMDAFEPNNTSAEFSGLDSYIAGSQILGAPIPNHNTGSPEIHFDESYGQVIGDGAGDKGGTVFISAEYQGESFEYDSTGVFVQAFPGTGNDIVEDPTNGNVKVGCSEFSPTAQYLGAVPCGNAAFNSEGYLYVAEGGVSIYSPVPKITDEPPSEPTPTSGTLNATVDPNGSTIEECHFEYGPNNEYGTTVPCEPASVPYLRQTQIHANISGLTSEKTYHYRVVIKTPAGKTQGNDETYTPHGVVGLRTDPATNVMGTAATLRGSFVGNGQDTHYYFEYGATTSYGRKSAVPPEDAGSPNNAPARTALSFELTELNPYTDYHYRIVASNGSGTSYGEDQLVRTAISAPLIPKVYASAVHSEGATLNGQINPGGDKTTDTFEWGASSCSANPDTCISAPTTEPELGSNSRYQHVSTQLSGLSPGTTYYFRIVATNGVGPSVSEEGTVTTYPHISAIKETCPNSLARQQTGAALLPDCRAYELVSASNAGGYDVESNLVPGQTPYPGYPEAENPPRVLYGVHDGGIPGTDHPSNKGVDPYVATRTENGWSTEYVGIPANNPFATAPFSSAPSGADASLSTFAFGGPGGCSPCFAGGYSGIPLRVPSSEELIQGMSGPENPGPTATPAGYIAKDLSANGGHLIFGSASRFAPGGNSGGSVPSIYDRDLKTEETHIVSNSPGGGPLPCLQSAAEGECHAPDDPNGIAELDVSTDGSRIIIAQKVSEDADHNAYWRLYMNIGDRGETVELTPGASDGVLYDGMTADGSRVFFTTKDQQLPAGSHSSAELYEAEVSEAGATLHLISTGTSGSCDPVESNERPHWNSLQSTPNCGVLAIGGGGGVTAEDGSIYFLSPNCLKPGKEPKTSPTSTSPPPALPPASLQRSAPTTRRCSTR